MFFNFPYRSSKEMFPGFSFSAMVHNIRDTLLSSTRPDDYDLLDEELTSDQMLPKRLLAEMREKKRVLLNCIHKHESAMLKLRDARIQCLKSKEKLKLYTTSLQAQQQSLVRNINNNNKREKALTKAETMSNKCIQEHQQNQVKFETLWLQEISLREKIEKLSRDLENELKDRMCDVIAQYVDKMNEEYGYEDGYYYEDVRFIAEEFYAKACRKYKFKTVQNEPCGEELIKKPVYTIRRKNYKLIKRKEISIIV
ncbi:hypothetical protein ACF0H5_019201 [Mactra antiquata]